MFVVNVVFIPTTSKAADFRSQCNLHIDVMNKIGGFSFSKFTSPNDSMMVLGKIMGCGRSPNDHRSIFIMLEPTRYFITDNHISTYSNNELKNPPGTCVYYLSKKVVKTKMHSGCK